MGNVAKMKNSKLYQKFMQKKDIVPTPSTPQAATVPQPAQPSPAEPHRETPKEKPAPPKYKRGASKKQADPPSENLDDSLIFAVPPKKQPIHPEQPLNSQNLSYSLEQYINYPGDKQQFQHKPSLAPEIGESQHPRSRKEYFEDDY